MNTLRNHFIKSSTGGQPNYTIYYTADLQVPFIGGLQKRGLTMWETGYESEPLAAFEVVKDSFADGYGEWGIKTSNPSCFYGLIKDKNGYEYSMDSDNFHTITGLIFPDLDYDYNNITSIGGPLLGGGEGNSLTDVTLPFYLEYLGLDTFKGSVNMQTILIPPNVKSIGNNCFKGCNSLTAFCCDTLTPPVLNGLDIFGNFNTIPNLKIYVGFVEDYLQNEDWSKYADIIYLDPCVISYKATDRPIFNLNNVTPSSYTYLGYNNGRGFMRFTKEVTEINGKLFDDNSTNLISNVYLPNTITSIGDDAFRYCYSLTSITIPNSVTSIGDYAFLGCSSLTSITIPNSVTSIGNNAFSSCSSLTAVTIPNSLTNIGSGAFSGCSSLPSITIPKNVTSIGQNAFYGCYRLTSVVWNAKNCSNLLFSSTSYASFYNILTQITSFVFGDEVEYIPAHLCYGMSKLTSTTIGDRVTSIGERAFISCSSLTSITIGNNVSSIGESAFYGCKRLTSVTLNSSAIVGNTYTSNSSLKHMFGSQVAEYIIGDTATSIGDWAFYGCSSLTSVTIGESVTNIGSGAFYGCTSLTYVTIPNSVTSIGSSAFRDCSSLTSVTIPKSLTSIGKWVFCGCKALDSITFNGTIDQWNGITKGANWKDGVPATGVVHCTDGDVAI